MKGKGIMLDAENDLKIVVRRDSHGRIVDSVVVDEREMQDAYIVLSINQGELKSDPLAGANLLTMIRRKERHEKIRKTVEIALERVGVRFEDIKKQFDLMINHANVNY